MSNAHHATFHQRITAAGLLVAMGIVFGDIGTSPLYTYNAIFHEGEIIDATKAMGVLSAVFWTLTLLTSLKYILIVLNADNKGEGGILSLYALVRRYFGKWLVIPAIIGAAFLMADGIITPPISVASAIEGLEKFYPGFNTVPWVIGILVILFLFQQIGTQKIGNIFGPVMLIWFSFIGLMGILSLNGNWQVLQALNPAYALHLLQQYPGGFWLLGGVFLCATGAEALYSDMGHVGRNNIRVSWLYIKIMLVLSYAGQTAWLINHQGQPMGNISPFYSTIPSSIYLFTVVLATLATIIASQALISGCFTLVSEGIRLNIWPRHQLRFPSNVRGQVYIPFINWLLLAACIAMVLYFKRSTNMEAAFGLSVTLTMLSTTLLVIFYLLTRRINRWIILGFSTIFLLIEGAFLVANFEKIAHGGWITLLIGITLSTLLFIWHLGRAVQKSLLVQIPIHPNLPILQQLSRDKEIPVFTTHLVYLNHFSSNQFINQQAIDSILTVPLKKAAFYWFVHVAVTDEPFTMNYKVTTLADNSVYHITFYVGFRIDPKIDLYFRTVLHNLIQNKEIIVADTTSSKYNPANGQHHTFLLTNSYFSPENDLPAWKKLLLKSYYQLKKIAVTEEKTFGLQANRVWIEQYPLCIHTNPIPFIKRIIEP